MKTRARFGTFERMIRSDGDFFRITNHETTRLADFWISAKTRVVALLQAVCPQRQAKCAASADPSDTAICLVHGQNGSHERRLDSKSIGYLRQLCVIRTRHVRTAIKRLLPQQQATPQRLKVVRTEVPEERG